MKLRKWIQTPIFWVDEVVKVKMKVLEQRLGVVRLGVLGRKGTAPKPLPSWYDKYSLS